MTIRKITGKDEAASGGFSLLDPAEFKAYSKWMAEGFERFISEPNFQVIQAVKLGGSLAPLCYWEA